MKATFVKAFIQAATNAAAIIGRVRLADSGGTEVTDGSEHAVRAILVAGEDVVGKVGLVNGEGATLTKLGAELQPGENYAGRVGSTLKWIRQKKSLAAAADYAAEDILSENATTGTPWTFEGVGRLASKGGYITMALAACGITALTPRLTLYLFEVLPTSTFADNAANVAPNLTDLPNYIGRIDFAALEDLGGMSEQVATPNTGGNLPLLFNAPQNRLYGVLVTRDAITGEAAGMEMHIMLGIEQA